MKIAQFWIEYNGSFGLWTVCQNGVLVVSLPTKEQAMQWAEKNSDY